MALYVDLSKIDHNKKYIRYKYYTNDPDIYGILEFNFASKKFKQIQLCPNDYEGLIFERAAMKIAKHIMKGEFPDKTCWAS